MSRIVVIGEEPRVTGFALAGARVVTAADAAQARSAWAELGDEVEVVILTQAAADALTDCERPERRLTVVIPP